MNKKTFSSYDPILDLEKKDEKQRVLNYCYMDQDKIPNYLEDGLINKEEAREIRREHLFNVFTDDYHLKLDAAFRNGDITFQEYCDHVKKYYMDGDQTEGEKEGAIEHYQEFDSSIHNELESCGFELGYVEDLGDEPPGWKCRKKRFLEFNKIDFRSPYDLPEMQNWEIKKACSLFNLIKKRYSESGEITKPLKFIEDLELNGFKLPKNLEKVLLESINHDLEFDGPFEMSKIRFARFKSKVNRYAATFWFNVFFHCPEVYKDFWGVEYYK